MDLILSFWFIRPSTACGKIGAQNVFEASTSDALRCPGGAPKKFRESEHLVASMPQNINK
jgi:hypothetical protein